jgi:hypothetical protein
VASSRKSWWLQTSSILEWLWPLCPWGPSMLQKCFGTLPQICASPQSQKSMDSPFDLMAWFLLWHALSIVGPYIDRCVPLQNQFQSIEFTTRGFQSTCRNITRMINGNRMHLSSSSSLIAKSLNTSVNTFLFLIHLQRNWKLYSLCHYGIVCIDWLGDTFYTHFRIRLT